MMRIHALLAAALAGTVLSACGGSVPGDGGPVGIPAPTPTPTPTATPAPTPAATLFRAEAAGPMIGELRFFRTPLSVGQDYAGYTTSRAGVFSAGATDTIAPPRGGLALVDDGTNAITMVGVDAVTGQALFLSAPRGATVISPITSLLAYAEPAIVKRALGLLDGPFRLRDATRDLARFAAFGPSASDDADTADDRYRINATNVRVIAYLHAFNYFRLGPGYASWLTPRLDVAPEMLAGILSGNPAVRLDTRAGLEQALRDLPPHADQRVACRGDVIVAAAHLIALYGEVIGSRLLDDADAARLMLGIQGVLQPTLADLMRDNSAAAAARVMALSANDVREALSPFAERAPASTSTIFAAPDFVRVSAGERTVLPLYDAAADISRTLAGNDTTLFATYPDAPIGKLRLTIAGLFVPLRFHGLLTVTKGQDEMVSVNIAGNFTGSAWFDYTLHAPNGMEAVGRVYVMGR